MPTTTTPTPKIMRLRPRHLRAIPSLVVLTTAMAWGALPDGEAGDDLQRQAGVTLSQPLAGTGEGGGLVGAAIDRYLGIK